VTKLIHGLMELGAVFRRPPNTSTDTS